jgi:hypothetical protein
MGASKYRKVKHCDKARVAVLAQATDLERHIIEDVLQIITEDSADERKDALTRSPVKLEPENVEPKLEQESQGSQNHVLPVPAPAGAASDFEDDVKSELSESSDVSSADFDYILRKLGKCVPWPNHTVELCFKQSSSSSQSEAGAVSVMQVSPDEAEDLAAASGAPPLTAKHRGIVTSIKSVAPQSKAKAKPTPKAGSKEKKKETKQKNKTKQEASVVVPKSDPKVDYSKSRKHVRSRAYHKAEAAAKKAGKSQDEVRAIARKAAQEAVAAMS